MLAKLRLVLFLALIAGSLSVAATAFAAIPDCNGLTPDIVGTGGDDVIEGTSGDDVIHARNGADIVNGNGGNDTICGGAGVDTINGGDGDDTIFGEGGADVIKGSAGADTIEGGNGNDTIRGNLGDDDLRGNAGADTLIGNGGNDTLKGGSGADSLSGGSGNDSLAGGSQDDTLSGGSGNDTMQGDKGVDELNGDAGDDDLRGGAGDDIILGGTDTDIANGGNGFDRCIDTETSTKCEDDDFNDPPAAVDDALATDEDTAIAVNVLADTGGGADSDPNGDALTVGAVNGNAALVGVPVPLSSGVSVTIAADGALSYDPSANLQALDDGDEIVDTVTYTASDGSETDDGAVTITVTGVNDAPEVDDDTADVDEDSSVIIDVLDNDSDVDGDELVVSSFTQGTNGAVTANEDGTLTYTPDENYNGPDSFDYTAGDGDTIGGATVTITVNAVNDQPVANDDTADVDEDDSVEIDVLDNDTDVDGDDLEVVFVGAAANGSVVIDEDSGLPVYTPDENFNGDDSFNYVVGDGAAADVGTVEITVAPVNDAPVADDDSVTVGEDDAAAVVTATLLAGDTDVDGETLTVNAIDDTATVGTVTLVAGVVSYDPNGQFEGLDVGETATDSFTYTVSDGTASSNTATVTVTINGANDAPVADDDSVTVGEDDAAAVVTATLLAGDTDVDGETLTVNAIDDTATVGTVTLVAGVVSYDPNGQFEGLDVGETATDSFTYTVSDGTASSNTATVTVTINGANDAPVADDDSVTVGEDDAAAVVTATLLAGDTDVDGETLTVNAIDDTATVGTVTLVAGVVSYDPNGQFEGLDVGETATDSFTYTVSDGTASSNTATVTVTINGANDAPVADDDSVTVGEDDAAAVVTATLLAGDTDVDGETLTVNAIDDTATVGTVTLVAGVVSYDPNGQFEGLDVGETATDSFTYTVSDGTASSNTATVTVTINGANDAPVADDDSVTVGEDDAAAVVTATLLAGDTDVDGETLTVNAIDDTATVGTVTLVAGVVSYDPNGQFEGLDVGETATDSFTYTVSDGTASSNTATVTVTINGANDAPVAVGDSDETDEDTSVDIDVLDNDTDIEDDDLTPIIETQPADGLAEVVDVGGSLYVRYTPDPDANGPDSFTYKVNDGNADSNVVTVNMTVNPTPDAPVAEDDAIAAVEDGPTVTGSLFDDNGNGIDDDVDGDDLTVTQVNLVAVPVDGSVTEVLSNGSIQVFDDGEFIFTPGEGLDFLADGASLIDSFTYVIDDGTGRSDDATVAVTLTGANDDPVAGDDPGEGDPYVTDEETPITLTDLLDNDTDADLGDTITIDDVDATSTEGAAVSITEDGDVLYDPSGALDEIPLGEFATDTFTYTVADGNGGFGTATVTVTVNGVNDDPVVVDDEDTMTEDDFETILDVLADDTDPDTGETATLDVTGIVVLDSVGVVTILGDDTIRYRPGENFAGLHDGESDTDVFEYTVEDGSGGAVNGTVTVTITGINEAWDAVDDPAVTVDEDDSVDISVLANDGEDEESDDPTVTIVPESGPTNGTVDVVANVVTYTPNADYFGPDSFDYQVADGFGGTDTATVTIAVNAVDDAPVARNDDFTTDEDTPIVAQNLLADNGNGIDDDADGDELSVVDADGQTEFPAVITLPIGNVTVGATGSMSFAPDENANGQASFDYTISDGDVDTANSTATVTITVNAINDDPVAQDDDFTTDEDTPIVAQNVLADNDNGVDDDVDGDELIVSEANATPFETSTVIELAIGDVTLGSDGSMSFAPDANANGEVSFTYTITDGELTDTATVTITVNAVDDAPVAQNDDFTTDEDTPIVAQNLLADNGNGIDDDADGDELSVVDADGQTEFPAVITLPIGNVTVGATGSMSFAPDENANGQASFDYTISDGDVDTANSTATVTITVNAINDDPVAQDDNFTTDEDTPIVAQNVLADNDNGVDDDVDGDELIVSEANATPFETSTVIELAIGDVTLGSDGSMSFAPDANANGEVSFTYTITDGELTDTATVTITVNAVNDAPVAVTDEPDVGEDDGDTPIDVLFNDTDVEDDDLSVASIDDTGTTGIVTLDTGVVSYDPDGQFEALDDDESTTDSFTYIANDGTDDSEAGTVTVTINGANDAPVANDDSGDLDEDSGSVTVDVLFDDTDVDVETLTIFSFTQPTNGDVTEVAGGLEYTPDEHFNGEDTFTYVASDGTAQSESATVTITVNAVNDAPVAVTDEPDVGEDDGDTPIDVLFNDTDVEDDDLSVASIDDTGTTGIVTLDTGVVSYDPDGQFEALDDDESTTDSFTYIANDGTDDSEAGTVTVTINGANDAPVANDDSGDLDEDSGSVTVDVLFDDTDVDVETLTIFSFTQPTNGDVTEVAGGLEYTPDEHFNGEDTFTYVASDGTAQSESATVTITVNAVNDAPVAVGDSDETDEDTSVDIDVLFNDTDIDEDDLTPIIETQPANGSASVVDVDGSLYIRYTPDENTNGLDSFTYKVNDGTADSNVVTVNVTVNAVNDAPVAVTDEPEVDEDDGDTVINVLGNDTDVENDELSVDSVDDTGTTGIVTLDTGVVSYDPDGQFEALDDGETATATFTYIANDGTDDSAPGTVDVTINGANDAPVASDDSGVDYVVPTGATEFVTGDVLANDSDVDVEPIAVIAFDVDGTLGLVSYNLDGTFTYEPPTAPALLEGETDSWTYTIWDGDVTDTATVTIVMNSEPVGAADPSGATSECCATDEDSVLNQNGVLDNDTDADGHTLVVSEVNGSAANVGAQITLASGALLTVAADGTFVYDPNGQFEALADGETDTDSFTYVATDGFNGFSETVTTTVTINGVNDAPVMNPSTYNVDIGDDALIGDPVVDVDAGDADLLDTLIYDITAGNTGVAFAIDPGTGEITVNGTLTAGEIYTLTVEADDGTVADSATVSITVIAAAT